MERQAGQLLPALQTGPLRTRPLRQLPGLVSPSKLGRLLNVCALDVLLERSLQP